MPTPGRFNDLSQAISGLSHAVSAADAALSVRIDGVGGGGSVTSTELSAVSAQAASALSQRASVLSQAISVADAALSVRIDTVSQAHSAVSQALSNEISNRTSADNALSQAVSVADAALSVRINTVSNAASAADARVTSVNVFISGISALSVGGISTHGLQSVVNALSNRISAVVAGAASATSNEVSIGDAAVSAQAASALSNAVSGICAQLSLVSQQISGISVDLAVAMSEIGNLVTKVINTDQTVSAATLTNISGFSISASAGGIYELEAMILINRGAAAQACKLGMTFSAMTSMRGFWEYFVSAQAAGNTPVTITSAHYNMGTFEGDSASGSIVISSTAGTLVSNLARLKAAYKASATGTVQLQIGSSTGAAQVVVRQGSWFKVLRIN